ncbi:MAG: FkbM family methyltransferase [Methylocella sp.]
MFKAEFGGLRKLSLRGRLLLDVGANRGQSIIAFQNAVPECQIVAFEPNRDLSACLATCYAGDASVKVEAVALASAPGHLTLYVPFYNGFSFDGLSSPRQDEAVRWFNSGRLYWFDRRKVTVEESTVPARTLDSYGLAPALINLHVQRAEIEVLKGARETLARHRPALLCAYPWPELIEILAEHGYRPYAYRHGQFIADRLGLEFTWFLQEEHIA